MKLSEMNTNQLADVLCKIAEPVDKIVNNPDFVASLKKFTETDKNALTKAGVNMRMYALLLPILLGSLKQETFTIIAALNGKTAEEIANQSGDKTINDIKAAFASDIIDFFR